MSETLRLHATTPEDANLVLNSSHDKAFLVMWPNSLVHLVLMKVSPVDVPALWAALALCI